MIRKPRTKGLRTQRMMSFRLDEQNALWLESVQNKGRYLNFLIEMDRKNDLSVRLKYHEQWPVKRPKGYECILKDIL